ncbi:MAG: SOS response-associated peptidase, partial [Paracoccaceae bacterium]
TSGPLLINARAETLAQKPAFAEACRQRRCLIPATGFYEWTKDAEGARDPWYIFRTNGAPLVFAGVWQDWEQQGVQMRTCAIVTCAAVTPMTALHHRQPVILEPEAWPLWLGEAGHGAARLMRPLGAEALGFHRVGRAVNSNRAAGPELIVAQDQARSEAPTRR